MTWRERRGGRSLWPIIALLWLIIALLWLPTRASAAGAPGVGVSPGADTTPGGTATAAPDGAASLDTREIDRYLEEARLATGGGVPQVTVGSLLSALVSGKGFSWRDLVGSLGQYLFGELIANSRLLGRLVAIAILAAVLNNVQSAFGGGTAGKVAMMVTYLATASLALGSFALAFGTARGVIDRLVNFMQALLPTLMALLAANGGMVTVPLLHPLMVGTISLASVMVRDIVLPMILVTALLELVGNFSSSYKLDGVVSLLRYGAVTAMGLSMVLILGVAAVLKASGPVADGVALRAGKFAASTFIPVIGKMFADAAELVVGSTHVLLSAVGLAGAVGVSLIVLFPLVKLVAVILTYRIAGAVIQPVSDAGVVDLLNGTANAVAMASVAVAAVAVLFFIGITILMGASNALLGLRQL